MIIKCKLKTGEGRYLLDSINISFSFRKHACFICRFLSLCLVLFLFSCTQEVQIIFDENYMGGKTYVFNVTSQEHIDDYAPQVQRDGYIFQCWYDHVGGEGQAYDCSQSIQQDLILYAKLDIVEYRIVYQIDEQVVEKKGNMTQKLSDVIFAPENTDERAFLGWYDNPNGYGLPVDLTQLISHDFLLFALWDQRSYTVMIDMQVQDESLVSVTVPKDVYVADVMPLIQRYGYEVDGWYSDAFLTQPVDLSMLMNVSTTLYPKWMDVDTTFYVSPSGNDENDGSFFQPLKTFEKAVEVMTPVDILEIFGGLYLQQLIINKSGIETSWLTFKAYSDDEVIIDGTGIITDPHGIWNGMVMVERQQYIEICGLIIRNSSGAGLFVADSHHINLINNQTINHYSPGIFAWSVDDLLIEGNDVSMSNMHPDAGLEDISLRDNKRVIIRNNLVHHSDNIGIDAAGGVQDVDIYNNVVEYVGLGFYVDAWDGDASHVEIYDNISRYNDVGLCVNTENGGRVTHVKVYRNLIYGNANDGMVIGWGGIKDKTLTMDDIHYFENKIYDNQGDGIVIYAREFSTTTRIYMYNNYIYDNAGSGIIISGLNDQTPYVLSHVWIVHNTIVNNGSADHWFSGGIGLGAHEGAVGQMTDLYIHNNLISNNYTFSIAIWPYGTVPERMLISHNLIDGYRDAESFGETKGMNAIEGAPIFINLDKRDLRISKNSPAIDQGMDLDWLNVDYEGDLRIKGSYDIGADECMLFD